LPQAVATRRVLVVDDDRVIRQCIAETLKEEGYEAATAVNGADALDLIRGGWSPDLVVLDMRMPVLDGWGFAREYRAMPGPHAPILVVTAAHDSLERLVELHAEDVLPKPFDLEQLVRSVRRCLGAR
jgi:two-component system chemotaxis response regulator CheY